jgi:ketosteroid isomerase-like protein
VGEQDVELIRRLHEAWIAGDREAALALADPGIEWVEPPDSLAPGTHRGAEGVEASMEDWTAPYEEYRLEVTELRDLGDGLVLACLHQYGRAHGSTVPVESKAFNLWTVRDGRAMRMEMYRTEAQALAAASRPAKHA